MDDQQWTLLDTEVTIVNRKKSYKLAKQKLSSIPYFVQLFSGSGYETTEIELDLDENSFHNIIQFILNNRLSISMESTLAMLETVDYLGMDELKQKYYDFYQSNFRLELTEEYLDFYEKYSLPKNSSEMLPSRKGNSFIGKYFLPISNTRAFLKFSVSLLERILKLKLVVSYEYQIVEAIDRWIKFNEKNRNQYLPRLIKLVNFCHLNKQQMKNVANILENAGLSIYTLQLNVHSFHACHPNFCEPDCESTRHSYKKLIAIYELDENTIEIQRLSKLNLWIKYDQFDRDETISSSLVETDHIFDIIYDSGRKGIRVDWNTKKFKYLKMFGEDNSYYGQAYKYITHDIPANPTDKIDTWNGLANLSVLSLDSIYLDDRLKGIYVGKKGLSFKQHDGYVICLYTGSDSAIYSLPSLDYRKVSSCTFQEPTETRSCLVIDKSEKVLYILSKQFFILHFSKKSDFKALNYSFLKSFIGSDSLDHIELISHNNSVLICNKQTETIYSYLSDTDDWQIISKTESSEKMITIASIYLPIGSV